MKTLCIIGLIAILAILFLIAFPGIFGAMFSPEPNDPKACYMLGLITTMIIVIVIISTITINFYFTPEFFGYQKVVSENCVDNEG